MSSTSGVGSNRGPVTTSQPVKQELQEVVGKDATGHQVKTKEGLPGGVKSGHTSEGRDIRNRTATLSDDEGFGSRSSSMSSEDSISTKKWAESLFSLTLDSEEYDIVPDDVFDSSDIPETTTESSPSSAESKVSGKSAEKPKYVQEETLVTKNSVSLAPGQFAVTTGNTIAVDGGVAKANSGPALRSTEITVDPNATKKANAKKLATEVQQEVAKRLKRSVDAGTADAEQIKDMLEALPKELHRPIRKAIFKKKVATAFSNFFHKLLAPKRAIAAAFSSVAKHFNGLVNSNISSGISENQASELAADEIVDGFHNPAALIKKMESEGFSTEAKEFKESIDLSNHGKVHSFENELLEDINKHPDTYPGLAGLPEPEKKLVARAAMGAAGIADLTRRPNNQLRLKPLSGDEALCSMAKLDHLMSILETQHATGVMLKLREYEKLNNYPFDELSWYGNVSSNIGDMGIFDDETGFASLEESPVVQREEFSNDVRGKLVAMQTNFQEELNKVKGDLGSMERMAEAAMVYAGVADYKGTSVNDGIQYKATQDLQGLRDVLSQLLKVLHRDDWAGGDTLFSLSELVDTLQEAKKVKATDIQQWWEYTVATRKSALDQVADQRYEQAVDEYIDKKLD